MILFTILRGISAPCLYSFTPSGFPLSHPTLSQGFHCIPPLLVIFSPLRGSPCASRFVTGATFHSTPACDLSTPSGFPLRIPLCHRGYISFHPCLYSFHPFGVSTYAPTHRCGNRKPRRGGKITGRGAAQRNPCGTDIPTPF